MDKTLPIWLCMMLIVAGVLAILLPVVAGLAVNALVAWILMFGGIVNFVWAWHRRGFGGMVWQMLLGVIYVAISVYMLVHPLRGLETLTLVLAMFLFVESVLEFVLGFQLRGLGGSGWILFDAVVTLVLSFLIWTAWPFDTGWAIGTLVGINLIFSGGTRLMLASAHRPSASAA